MFNQHLSLRIVEFVEYGTMGVPIAVLQTSVEMIHICKFGLIIFIWLLDLNQWIFII